MSVCLIQFAKTPELGRVKTRMQPHLSQEQSCALHRALTQQVMSNLYGGEWRYCLYWSGSDDDAWRRSLIEQVTKSPNDSSVARSAIGAFAQMGKDLGARMHLALQEQLRTHKYVVLVGSDCPALQLAHIEQCVSSLKSGSDVCFVAADDGGYVAVAVSQPQAAIFEGIDWGTDKVLSQSLQAAERAGLCVSLLPSLPDIDRPEDLARLADYPWASELIG